MHIPFKALNESLQHTQASVYILIGQEPFLLDNASQKIKKYWRQQYDSNENPDALDIQRIDFNGSAKDWQSLHNAMMSLSLFASRTLYQLDYNKSSFDKQAKEALNALLGHSPLPNTLIIQAPQCKIKDFASLKSHPDVVVVQIWPLKDHEFINWIFNALSKRFMQVSRSMAQQIAFYTHGNLYAASQVIKKLILQKGDDTHVSESEIEMQLHHQCEFQSFELAEACLNGDSVQALRIITSKIKVNESALLLWVLSNEVRQIRRLQAYNQTLSWTDACQKAQIWTNKSALYQKASNRLTNPSLLKLHHLCAKADVYLKTGQNLPLQNTLEQIGLGLCTNELAMQHG